MAAALLILRFLQSSMVDARDRVLLNCSEEICDNPHADCSELQGISDQRLGSLEREGLFIRTRTIAFEPVEV